MRTLFEELLGTFASIRNDNDFSRFHSEVIALVAKGGEKVGTIATEFLSHVDPAFRAGAAYVVGRVAEAGGIGALPAIEASLLPALLDETDERAVEMLSSALGSVWSRGLGTTWMAKHAFSPSRNVRLAAATWLALSVTDPVGGREETMLQLLSSDDDPEVRRWARFALD